MSYDRKEMGLQHNGANKVYGEHHNLRVVNGRVNQLPVGMRVREKFCALVGAQRARINHGRFNDVLLGPHDNNIVHVSLPVCACMSVNKLV